MPYSPLPDPLPAPLRGVYQLSVTADLPDAAASGTTLDVTITEFTTGEPDTPGVMDNWFQAVVDALAGLPYVTSVTANKGLSININQTITPTGQE